MRLLSLGLLVSFVSACNLGEQDPSTVDWDGDGLMADVDCDDSDAGVGGPSDELCDGLDNDCDGLIDGPSSIDQGTWYADADGDGQGDASLTVQACEAPAGYVAEATDCDDADAAVFVGATEACNGVDDNCDGVIDTDATTPPVNWYPDADGDGFGDPRSAQRACAGPAGYVLLDTDCDDGAAEVSPAATEACNGVDDDCDGEVDEAGASGESTWYADADGDGSGDAATAQLACEQPAGSVADDTDCDDTSAAVHPSATEACNGTDDDCDGEVDEAGSLGESTWYADADGDDFGDASSSQLACAQPSGFVADGTDCDDASTNVSPRATEACNGLDDDCDGEVDEAGASGETTWYADADADSFGAAAVAQTSCAQPSGYVADGSDCDDADAAVSPAGSEACNEVDDDCDGKIDEAGALGETLWYADADADSFGDPTSTRSSCARPAGHVGDNTDCDDGAPLANPAMTETCNGVDDDCDGDVDEAGASDEVLWYADGDGDGFGDAASSVLSCGQPSGYVLDATDCDDAAPDVNPVAVEACNSVDDDCDGDVDELGALGESTWYADVDADGFGDLLSTTDACAQPAGYLADSSDCDDTRSTSYPGAPEVCNGVDDDCDTEVDEAGAQGELTWYADVDGDGFGDLAVTAMACVAPSTFVADSTDCDDGDPTISPAATEVCNNLDDDCDTFVDELGSVGESVWYADTDVDGFGDPNASTNACVQPLGHVADNTDCADADPAVFPGAPEVCNSIDDDCDTAVDEAGSLGEATWFTDLDGDGYGDATSTQQACAQPPGHVADSTDCVDDNPSVFPGAPEVCNSIDDDCDTAVDEAGSIGETTWFADADGDGFGARNSAPTHCGDVLAAGGVSDGVYTIDPDGDGPGLPYDVYCDQTTDGGGWTLVFDQDIQVAPGYRPVNSWMSVSPMAYTPGQYSILDQLDSFRNADGSLELNLVWPKAPNSGNVHWTQTLNPLTDGGPAGVTTVLGMNPANQSGCGPFDGLRQEVSPALINADSTTCWWFAVGTEACHNDDICGIPSYNMSVLGQGGSTPQAMLFVRSDIPGAGSASVDACVQPAGYLSDNTDCDDATATTNPLATDTVGDNVDNNCDGVDGFDGDGDGDPSVPSGGTDCDDADPSVNGPAGNCSTAQSCATVLAANPSAASGPYNLDLDGAGPEPAIDVYCDMSTDGGGWTLAFVANSMHNAPIFSDAGGWGFGSGQLDLHGNAALANPPGVSSTSTAPIAAWVDINTADFTHFRLGGYSGGSTAYLSDPIARAQLRIGFGSNGYLLYDSPSDPARLDGQTYYWCGGDRNFTDWGVGQVNQPLGAPANCKGHSSLGSGWDFTMTPNGNTGLTLCGAGGASDWMYTSLAGGLYYYGTPGGAQAIWIR